MAVLEKLGDALDLLSHEFLRHYRGLEEFDDEGDVFVLEFELEPLEYLVELKLGVFVALELQGVPDGADLGLVEGLLVYEELQDLLAPLNELHVRFGTAKDRLKHVEVVESLEYLLVAKALSDEAVSGVLDLLSDLLEASDSLLQLIRAKQSAGGGEGHVGHHQVIVVVDDLDLGRGRARVDSLDDAGVALECIFVRV